MNRFFSRFICLGDKDNSSAALDIFIAPEAKRLIISNRFVAFKADFFFSSIGSSFLER